MQRFTLFTYVQTILLLVYSVCAWTVQADPGNMMVRFDRNGKYQGLTQEAKTLITSSRDLLRARRAHLNKNFKQFSSIYDTAQVNRLAEGNMFLYGPPGGAKSKFVTWLFNHEAYPAFELQMHQMMTEQAFRGTQNYQTTDFTINTNGTLAQFKIALIDEFDKGNPAALAALLDLLNERVVRNGNTVVKTSLETVFATSNANLYEIVQQFAENGMRTTAAALLNRFTGIAFIPNWLQKVDQKEIDQRYMDNLDALFNGTIVEDDDLKLSLDWEGLRALSSYILRPHDEFLSISRELTGLLREKTIAATKSSKENSAASYHDELPYYATAEYTERLRQKIHHIVTMSLLLDILESPLTDDIEKFENLLQIIPSHRLPIGPLSIWRAHTIVTTSTFGEVNLIFPTDINGLHAPTLDFGSFFLNAHAMGKKSYIPKDSSEEHTIKYIMEEQKRFKEAFTQLIAEHKEVLEQASRFSSIFACLQDTRTLQSINDIERMLYMSRIH